MSAVPTREQFLEWRRPRRGTHNPEPVDSPVWRWLVAERCDAYEANERFDGPSPFDEGPGWCFDRMGMPTVELPDGRVVHVAGEHEDHYDPDFYIYNDVVVRHPDGRIDVYCYPEQVFPPTDFHSATFDARRGCIWLVGNLGYPDDRRVGRTQVLRLDVATFAVEPVATTGAAPGWMHAHTAALDDDGRTLVVSRGIVQVDDEGTLRDGVDDWALDLAGLRWTRRTTRPYREWAVTREDDAELHLFEIGSAVFAQQHPQFEELRNDDTLRRLADAGVAVDAEAYDALWVPPLAYTPLELFDGDEADDGVGGASEYADNRRHDHARVQVGDALVRYRQGAFEVAVKVEGPMTDDDERAVVEHTTAMLAKLQKVPCRAALRHRQP